MSSPSEVRMMSADEVYRLLPVTDCVDALERAWRLGADRAMQHFVAGAVARRGKFHVKAALDESGARPLFVAKINGNYPGNPQERGLPTIQGVVVVCDATDGTLLALIDSPSLTAVRTAAATGVAARHLSSPNARVLAIIGCGAQALAQAQAVCAVRNIERLLAFDTELPRSMALVERARRDLSLVADVVPDITTATLQADVVVTSTSSRSAILDADAVRPGTFVAAVGADNPDKHEIDPDLMAAALVVVDDLDQCATSGDLHHALAAGRMQRSHVAGTLADVVASPERFAWTPSRTVIFDSTGIPFEDVVACAALLEKRGKP